MHYIVGLGNPDSQYNHTRHNVGFAALDWLQTHHHLPKFVLASKYSGEISEGVIPGGEVFLLKPHTYMNNSGQAVKKVVTPETINELIVIHDEVDLPLGEIKVSVGRGGGGHNGIASIIGTLKNKDFIRIRVGISPTSFWTGKMKRPSADRLSIHVLGKFRKLEKEKLAEVFVKVDAALDVILSQGVTAAMNRFN